MIFNCSELAKCGAQKDEIILEERLPPFIKAPCVVKVTYSVEMKDDFYLLHLQTDGDLEVSCQRCMDDFKLAYKNTTILAICRSEARAEQLLEHYECIVSSNWQIDLDGVLTDEIYLYVPQYHAEAKECNPIVTKILCN